MSQVTLSIQAAYTLLHDARERREGTHTDTSSVSTEHDLEQWFRVSLVETLYRTGKILDEDFVFCAVHVAELLASRRHMEYRSCTRTSEALALGLARCIEHDEHPVRLLVLGERAFIMYCFFPERLPRRQLHYRKYASDFGRAAYRSHARATDSELGMRMERVFEPLGEIVRENFVPKT